MLTPVDSIRTAAGPEMIEEWLMDIVEHYRQRLPEHVRRVLIDGWLGEGTRFCNQEYLKGCHNGSRFLVTPIQRDGSTLIEFKGLSILDRAGGGSFLIEPAGEGCVIAASVKLRPAWPGLPA